MYLYYRKNVRTEHPITGLTVLAGPKDFPMQNGYTRINVDINEGLKGIGFVYLFYTRSTSLPPITGIMVMDTVANPYVYPSSASWVRIKTNCNHGTEGNQIHIYYTYNHTYV